MKIEAYNIKWDTDGEDVSLPKSVVINVPDDEEDIADYVSDYLSDEYGFCHFGFEFHKESKMTKNVRVLIVCVNDKQTEKLYNHLEANKPSFGDYVDTCYYHGEEKAVMMEFQSDDKKILLTAVNFVTNTAKELNLIIKNFAFESGF